MTEETPQRSGQVVHLKSTVNLSEQVPACVRCGYRDIVDPMGTFGLLGASPTPEQWRYVLSAARRLDTAHRQFERVRAGLDELAETEGNVQQRRTSWIIVGDAELAIIALHRSIAMSDDLRDKFQLRVNWPDELKGGRKTLGELRDAYEHIDERAQGFIKKGRSKRHETETAFTAFQFRSLFAERRLRYDKWSVGIDDEIDELIAITRQYLLQVWAELKARSGESG